MITKRVKSSIVAATLALTVLPQISNAGDRAFGDIYRECGLGAMIFYDNQTAAAISNIIWDLGTTAISSNLTTESSCEGGKAKVAKFINESYDLLESDLASGSGEYLDTLANLVASDSEKSEFISTLRERFSLIVSNSDYDKLTTYQKAEKLYNIVY